LVSKHKGWSNFPGFTGYDSTSKPTWAIVLSYFIVLLPAIDMSTAYPLNLISLAHTLEKTLLDEQQQTQIKFKMLIRYSIIIITAILAYFVWNFTFVIILSGLCGFIGLYGVTAYTEYGSYQLMQTIINNDEDHSDEPFKNWVSHKFWIISTIITACIGSIVIIGYLIYNPEPAV